MPRRLHPACLISFRMVVFPQPLILDQTMEMPGRVHITATNGVRSRLFTTARVATPSLVVVLVFSRRPDSSGSSPNVDGGKVGEYGQKCQRQCRRLPRLGTARIRQDPDGDAHRGLVSVAAAVQADGMKEWLLGLDSNQQPIG